MKAGNAANAHDFQVKDQHFSRSQVQKMCMEQAREWQKKVSGSVLMTTHASDTSDDD